MTLFVDATRNESLTLALFSGGRWNIRQYRMEPRAADRILVTVDRFLQGEGIAPSSVRALAVATGPGSYAGIRTTVACANAWALTHQVPLLEIAAAAVPAFLRKGPSRVRQTGHLLRPVYGKPPQITTALPLVGRFG